MSTNLPSLESRMKAQEYTTALLNARIEEAKDEAARDAQHIMSELDNSFKHMQTWVATKEDVAEMKSRLDKVDTRLDKLETSVAEIKIMMATKDDISAMETRLLAAIQAR